MTIDSRAQKNSKEELVRMANEQSASNLDKDDNILSQDQQRQYEILLSKNNEIRRQIRLSYIKKFKNLITHNPLILSPLFAYTLSDRDNSWARFYLIFCVIMF